MKNEKGFTLIELLVVIAIIGLLSTLAVVALSSARLKARDAKRQAELKTLQSAIELYLGNNEVAPPVPGAGAGAWKGFGTGTGALAAFLPGGMPEDPSSTARGWCYCRHATDKYKYLIAVALEENKTVSGDLDGPVTSYLVTDCLCNNDAAPSAVIDCTDSGNGSTTGGKVGPTTFATADCLGTL